MSIPPLVCSTPPPPDQCEEDKDPEDFEIHYRLSQDDDNEYDYGDFSTYNHFQTNISSTSKKITTKCIEHNNSLETKNIDKEQHSVLSQPMNLDENCIINKELKSEDSDVCVKNVTNDNITNNTEDKEIPLTDHDGNNDINNIDLKFYEDNTVEDLNLKLDANSGISNIVSNEENDGESINVDQDQESLNIPSIDTDINEENTNTSVSDSQFDIDVKNKSDEIDSLDDDDDMTDLQTQDVVDVNNKSDTCDLGSNEVPNAISSDSQLETVQNDDFEDFDDFQFISSETKPTLETIDNCDNPWDKKIDNEPTFGDFTATFDNPQIDDNNDDFEDFDDFKSSNLESDTKEDSQQNKTENSFQQVPVLDLELSDKGNQILDSINQMLNTIFLDEIPESDDNLEYNLDTLLSETWGHLMETDTRQPYIVNWNNSLGQKTLLKALCIDSRNILFGPKWSYNMPKYAVNLGAIPLQPQKPISQTSVIQKELNPVDKLASKMGSWNDPFPSDGQESCNPENEAAIQRESVNIDVFESGLSVKPEIIYPNSLNIQPLRQISLPDTHIFTPTDSETPRSKTIHYDTGPTVMLPEQSTDTTHIFPTEPSTSKSDSAISNTDDNDYWEFQDFKSNANIKTEAVAMEQISAPSVPVPSNNDTPSTSTTYPPGLLQPIKMEPIIPKLNWPDPGEVKEVFEDFTNFAANPSWNDDKLDTNTTKHSEKIVESNVIDGSKETENKIEIPSKSTTDKFDDEFDTFQYALPSKSNLDKSSLTNPIVVNSSHMSSFPPKPLQVNKRFDETFTKLSFDVPESISSMYLDKNKPLPKLSQSTSSAADLPNKPFTSFGNENQNNILQPIPVSMTSNSNNKQQILQPLSLESYSQINWPSPGIDLQDLSKFNPVETLNSLKNDLSVSGSSKNVSPIHNHKASVSNVNTDEDVWGEFVSSKPKPQQVLQKKTNTFVEDDEWTDFVSSPSVKPQNGLNTISLNVHTNLNMQKNMFQGKISSRSNNPSSIDIPTLNYITPKGNTHKTYNDRHFQNL